jgi:Flp pilus assembly protein TadG
MHPARFLKRPRRGTIAVLAAFFMVVLVALMAFAIDIGVVINSRNDMQRAADAGALAAALELASNPASTTDVGRQYVRLNSVVTSQLSDAEIAVEVGKWDKTTKSFSVSSLNADAVRITLQQSDQPLFFGRVLGTNQYNMNASAIATFKPRDIMLVLDYSGSMFDEDKISGLKSATTLFCDTVQQTGQGKDRIGFVRYSTDAILECALTYDIAMVSPTLVAV